MATITQTQSFKYNVSNYVSKEFAGQYDVREEVATSQRFKYQVAPITIGNTWAFRYTVREFVYKPSFTLIYSVYNYVNKTYTLRYNVIAETVSNDWTGAYTINPWVSSRLIVAYDIDPTYDAHEYPAMIPHDRIYIV